MTATSGRNSWIWRAKRGDIAAGDESVDPEALRAAPDHIEGAFTDGARGTENREALECIRLQGTHGAIATAILSLRREHAGY